MRNHLRSTFIALTILCILTGCNRVGNVVTPSFVCPANRFTTEQFTSITAVVAYTSAVDYQSKTVTLQANVLQPTSDTLAHRPLIIYCHGGGFTTGAKNDTWASKFCLTFAKRGYVVASIDYRMGLASVNNAEVLSAQIRAVQDAKAAVRYFKQTAIETGNPYRIDTAQIFLAGESTGAMIALQAGFLRSVTDFSKIADPNLLSSLGGIEGVNPIAYSSQVTGVISLTGALPDLNWLNNSNMPIIGVHSSNDGAIPYKAGVASPYLTLNSYGSFLIDSAATIFKFNSSLLTLKKAGTAPYITSTKYADSTINYVSAHLYDLIDCQSLGHR